MLTEVCPPPSAYPSHVILPALFYPLIGLPTMDLPNMGLPTMASPTKSLTTHMLTSSFALDIHSKAPWVLLNRPQSLFTAPTAPTDPTAPSTALRLPFITQKIIANLGIRGRYVEQKLTRSCSFRCGPVYNTHGCNYGGTLLHLLSMTRWYSSWFLRRLICLKTFTPGPVLKNFLRR
jgi:hypothetical protein